jgi:hypothetical protein
MRYMLLTPADQESLLRGLEEMPALLESTFTVLSPAEAILPGPEDTFSPVEQCWHLADLEREGFGERIRRLLVEDSPDLPDFDGAAVAKQRGYRRLSFAEGIRAFRAARFENIAALRGIGAPGWTRTGTQEGVGKVSLCDIPVMMAEHDLGHRHEIEAWLREHRSSK